MDFLITALKIAATGLIGIFTAILVIYLVILLLAFAFPERKRIRRLISRRTGEVLSEEELRDN